MTTPAPSSSPARVAARVCAGVAGAAGLLLAFFGAGWVALAAMMSVATPSESRTDGDPCCAYPDTWGEAVSWSGGTVALGAADVALTTLALACLSFAAGGARPRGRRWVVVPVAVTAGFAVVVGLLVLRLWLRDS